MKDDLLVGKLNEKCLLPKLYLKLRKMFLSPRRESNPTGIIDRGGKEVPRRKFSTRHPLAPIG